MALNHRNEICFPDANVDRLKRSSPIEVSTEFGFLENDFRAKRSRMQVLPTFVGNEENNQEYDPLL